MSAIKIQSKFDSSCKTCGGNVATGEYVFWAPGQKGVSHTECPDNSSTEEIVVEPLYKLEPPHTREDFPNLFEHQREIVNTVEKHPDSALYLAWEAGAGKTLGSLAAAEASNNYPLVVVCPSVVKINWQREVKQWLGKDAQILVGRTPEKIESDIAIVNYDILSYWVEPLKAMQAKAIVFDESVMVKNPDAARTQAAKEIGKSVKGMKLMLSGTPTPNSVHDLVVPLDILGVLKHFGGSRKYIRRYCPPIQTKWGVSHKKARNTRELQRNLVNACFIRKRREDCLDLPEKIRVDVPVAVKVETDNEFYKPLLAHMQKGTLTEAKRVLKDHASPLEIKNHLAKERVFAGEAKIKDITELAKNIDDPLVIMVHHKSVVDQLMKNLKGKKPVKLVGGMTAKAKQSSVDKFQGGETDLLIASITAAGIGINLQRGTQMIMGELPFTYAEVDQAESRCHRTGAKNSLTVHRVVGIGTFDEIIVNIIARKEAISAAVEDGEEIEVIGTDDIIARRLVDMYLAC